MTTASVQRSAIAGALLALGLVLLLATPAHAQPKVTVSGATSVGTKLTAKTSGGQNRGIIWQACAVKPNGRTCPAASLTRLGTRRTYTLADATTGAYVRAQAKIRRANGTTRTVTSPWRGPVTAQGGGGGGGGGAGGAKVGLYRCPLFPYGTTYISILSGGQYLGPYSNSTSTPGNYRLIDGPTKYPGGKVFEYLDGPYAQPTWRNEYYPDGFTIPGGSVYTETQILLAFTDSKVTQVCSWIQADPPWINR